MKGRRFLKIFNKINRDKYPVLIKWREQKIPLLISVNTLSHVSNL